MYVKLFSSIFDSSVWVLPTSARIVWITLLGMADRDGFVFASPFMISRRANIPLAEVEISLALFLAPDPNSQSKEYEGRRLAQTPDGYCVLNYRKYRELRSAEERRMQQAEWMAQKRKAEKEMSTVDESRPIAYSEAPSLSEAPSGEPSLIGANGADVRAKTKKPHRGEGSADKAFGDFWAAYPRKVAKGAAWKVWKRMSPEDKGKAAAAVLVYAEVFKGASLDRKTFIPHPATWLNGGRWDDDPASWKLAAGSVEKVYERRPGLPLIGKSEWKPTPEEQAAVEELKRRHDKEENDRLRRAALGA